MARARLISTTIQLAVVLDDGETLHPLQVQPLTVPIAEWPPDLDAVLAQINHQVNPPEPPAAD